MTDDWEEYYLVKVEGGKHHIVERQGKVRAMCGEMYSLADGYIRGRKLYLAFFMSLNNLVCKNCRKCLKRKLRDERRKQDQGLA